MRGHHIIASCLLACVTTAQAGGGHDHPSLHGGLVAEAKNMDFELVAQANEITLHLRDHGKPVSAKGGSAKLTLLQGSQKSSVMLFPAGDSHLQAKGSFAIKSGTKVVALVTLPGKKPIHVRFAIQ